MVASGVDGIASLNIAAGRDEPPLVARMNAVNEDDAGGVIHWHRGVGPREASASASGETVL